jgi:hypothetical protein
MHYVSGIKMNKKLTLDSDIVSWVVEEAFVKDGHKTIKTL